MSHLDSEKSPYLRQHVSNPVDWYPWSESLFTRARSENKLIFLSIGYSTCHWCHVMAHECFEDDEVASLLNKDFFSIKVDREERPDIDQVYMEVCQRLTGRGGWPLTIFMTPEAKPFYAATYIPKHGRHGQPGMMDLLPWIVTKWHETPEFLSKAADEIVAEMRQRSDADVGGKIDTRMIEEAERNLKKSFDRRFGGFGRAPKFPRPHDLSFLLQRYCETGETECLSMVEKTLHHMRCGGIYDHLGGGFHRYSTDDRWLVPHFEKMLYDQATIVEAYLGALQATGNDVFADTAKDVLAYLCRDMLSGQGGFYSAEDADSEGEEGAFYLWSVEQIQEILGANADSFCEVYNLKDAGNYHDEVSGKLTGKNILHLSGRKEKCSAQHSLEKKRLFDARSQRVRPHLDDKVIAGWNGMAMSAFARAGKIFADNGLVDRARHAASFVLNDMRREDGRLLRRFRQGEAAIPAFSEDYAYVCRGLLDIYGCDFDVRWLKSSIELARMLIDLFQDSENGRLYDTPIDGEELLVRPSSTFDGAVPSAASIALEVFGRLFLLTGDPLWRSSADKLMQSLSREVSRYPSGYTQLLLSSGWVLQTSREIVVVGEKDDVALTEMLAVMSQAQLPYTAVIHKSSQNAEELASLAPYTNSMRLISGNAAAYVCHGFSCQRPAMSAVELRELLDEKAGSN